MGFFRFFGFFMGVGVYEFEGNGPRLFIDNFA